MAVEASGSGPGQGELGSCENISRRVDRGLSHMDRLRKHFPDEGQVRVGQVGVGGGVPREERKQASVSAYCPSSTLHYHVMQSIHGGHFCWSAIFG